MVDLDVPPRRNGRDPVLPGQRFHRARVVGALPDCPTVLGVAVLPPLPPYWFALAVALVAYLFGRYPIPAVTNVPSGFIERIEFFVTNIGMVPEFFRQPLVLGNVDARLRTHLLRARHRVLSGTLPKTIA